MTSQKGRQVRTGAPFGCITFDKERHSVSEATGEQPEQLPKERTGRPKAGLTAHFLSLVILVYFIGWAAGCIFLSREFGIKNAIVISMILAIPFALIISMRSRWNSLGVGDWGLLVMVLSVAAVGTKTIVDRWYESGWHYRHGRWTFFPPPSQESLKWSEFKEEFYKDASFKNLKVHRPTNSKNSYWLEGSLESEADLDRLVALAKKCGIDQESLDGPFRNSISIVIPGTVRSKSKP